MESSANKHRRNMSKSSRPRSSTKGPLDAPEDLPSSAPDSLSMARVLSPTLSGEGVGGTSLGALDPLMSGDLFSSHGKDLSYLLRSDIYHPLSQLSVPPALRTEFVVPVPGETVSTLLGALERLLAEGHFLVAAHLCATLLTPSFISATDSNSIFTVLYLRLACLELSGNAILAAQESKALEDLSSTFYYVGTDQKASEGAPEHGHHGAPRHIVPWPLRLLAVRLQSIGFGDPRRGIGGLYELGLEARREILRPGTTNSERAIWSDRLADLGVRSVNALIEMGDLETARRSLANLTASRTMDHVARTRKALLLLKIGDLDAAKKLQSEAGESDDSLLKPLLSMAEGRYLDATSEWRALLDSAFQESERAMIVHNLAVCLLYTGQLNEARPFLESLISENNSFGSLTFNLSTIYELCSEKAATLKTQLVERVSKQPVSGHTNLEHPNSDFKL
ncbi:hypothetical protein ASPZODRAFT_55774 [Penicilliopsis zonata CBS 506.65]|uniref:Trafficking protein particle complex subunit 12 n=1 Tax=Penicilliopsis zonata CBS 506.65 TaxID=1073090 RepID=A0A1L9SWD9_9EURO|nr:hypothetical protein ASPZODRAFT_55774 [Penicilliopsis zonata CBS 506.65]OJJ51508.1 hypothetical protein ASPZODRAFT_55774 [Penicilliopsis zonata CBS 506.65]